MMPNLCDAPKKLPRYAVCLLALGLLVALAVSVGGCDKSLGVDDVTWLCQSDSDCGSDFRCSGSSGSPKHTCLPLTSSASDATGGDTNGGDAKDEDVHSSDVAAGTRNCEKFCSVLDSLSECEGATFNEAADCDAQCEGLGDACFGCLEKANCSGVVSCVTGACLPDAACLSGGFCDGGFPFPGFP